MATPRKHWFPLDWQTLPAGPCVYLMTATGNPASIQCKIGSTIDLKRRYRELRADRFWQPLAFIPCAGEPECRALEREVLEEMNYPRGGNTREVRWIPTAVVRSLLDAEA
jgi:hypothetical protein